MRKTFPLFLLLAFLYCPLKAQTIVQYDTFEDFEPRLYQKNDTTYIINFWATWCKPCVEELPYFEGFAEKYSDQKIKLLLVSLDFPWQIESKLMPFIEKNKLKSEVVVLKDTRQTNWVPKVSDKWSGAIPATVIYNDKKRGFYERNFYSIEELEEVVSPFKSNID